MSDHRPTIYDVAKRAGVSNATVSRALNPKLSELVKPGTRKKVMKVAKELGYKANTLAKALATNKSTQVAVICSDLARGSVAEMVKGILNVAQAYKYSIVIVPSPQDDKTENLVADILSMRVDGVLYMVDEITEKREKFLKEINDTYNIPLVLVNTCIQNDESICSVQIDYELAGYEVTKELIKEGRKKIALLTTLKRYPVSILKENGYIKAMDEANLTPRICYTSGNLTSNYDDITAFLKTNDLDGVIGVRDSIAIACMNIMKNSGKDVPNDVSFYGFQNTRYGLLTNPQLSSVDIPVSEIGAKAMKILTSMMEDEKINKKGRVLLKHGIINRGTTLKR